MLHLTFSNSIEAADGERRIISGKIAPYNEVGYTSAGPVVFERGSIAIADETKVKLLMQHQSTQPVGRMLANSVKDNTDGIYASFKISSSTRGQDALVLAQENLVSGLSVGVDVSASKQMKGYLLVTAAVLKEVSLVESAAFDSAAVTDIAAAKAALEAASMKTTIIHTEMIETETETETESEAAVTTAPIDTPDVPAEKPVEAAPVQAARPIIRPSVLDSQTVRTPITSMGKYTEHKIQAALGNQDSQLYVTAADDSFTTNPGFNPTQYLSEFVTNTRFGTPTIDACSQGVLPPTGMTINVPSLVTSAGGGTGVAPVVTVEAEAGAVQNTGMETSYLTGTVQKYSGMNTLSVELLERAGYPGFYDELTQQLQNAYLTAIDTAALVALQAAGSFGTATTGDSAGIIAYSSEAASAVYKNTGYFAQNYIGNPAQYQALLGAVDTTGRPIYNAIQPMNAAGQVAPSSIRGNVLGLDLYVDKNFTQTAFDDNSAVILAPEAFTVYRGPQAFMSVNVVSNLQVQIAIYGFMATIAKMPNGIIKFAKLP
jgi:HK97 family phage prohead protease